MVCRLFYLIKIYNDLFENNRYMEVLSWKLGRSEIIKYFNLFLGITFIILGYGRIL